MNPAALETQVGGDHYKTMEIQPVEFIHKNGIGYLEGNVIKYVARHALKNGVEDLLKARHYLDLLLDLEYGYVPEAPPPPVERNPEPLHGEPAGRAGPPR